MSVASDDGERPAHPPILQDVSVNGQPCSALYDTGSSICLVSEKYLRLSGTKVSCEPPSVSILDVTGNPIEIIGEVNLKVDILSQSKEHTRHHSWN